jgi:glyoxylase-like metal-dependent hydrolase (beta-lactamase superfamily II)
MANFLDNNSSENNLNVFHSPNGGLIFQLRLREFPGLFGYVYLVLFGDYQVMIDTGSGFGYSNLDLETGFASISNYLNREFKFEDITHILLTHGHIDHFGGLNYVRLRTNASVGIHELDRRIITNYEERLTIIAQRLEYFFIEAGVDQDQCEDLIQMYKLNKSLYTSSVVDFTYDSIGMALGPFKFLHVPGHSAGHVVIRFQDVMFSGDHVLDETSPHQAPEQITLSTGLDHYLQSLEKLRSFANEVSITFGGHEQPIINLENRLDAIRDHHFERLQRVIELMKEPKTISQVSDKLFGEINGYHKLLALEETGAHVEYLYQRGLLSIANISEIENGTKRAPAAIKYQCTGQDCAALQNLKISKEVKNVLV